MAGRQTSSGRRGGTFDAFDVARRGAALSGTVNVASLPRVADRLVEASDEAARAVDGIAQRAGDDSAKVSWKITGTGDAQGRPALVVELRGGVPLECQRCLQAFTWPVDQQTTLLLARDEREVGMLDADDELEVILADAPQDTLTLIEDELLLALPFAPHCERPGCAGKPLQSRDPDMPGPSAFAALAGLKNDDAK